jgi:hypothetical protein
MNGGIDDGYVDDELMMVLMEIDASFSQVSFCSSFDGVIVLFVKIYGGGSAVRLHRAMMGMRLLVAARVPLSFYSLAEVGFAFWCYGNPRTKYGIRVFTNVIRFEETFPMEVCMVIWYGPLVVKVPGFYSNLGAISSYEHQFRCSSAR